MAAKKWIAEQRFGCVAPTGEKFSVTVKLGMPVRIQTEGGKHEYARCPLSLEPMAKDRWTAGSNEFQALCLALDYIRTVFKVYLAEGGRIYWDDSDSPVDVSSPWFAPMPSFATLTTHVEDEKPRARRQAVRASQPAR